MQHQSGEKYNTSYNSMFVINLQVYSELHWKTKIITSSWNIIEHLKGTFSKVHSQVWDSFCNWKPFKNDEKFFLFHLKIFSWSQDIWTIVLTFWSCREMAGSKRLGYFQNFWCRELRNKQLRCTYCAISQEVKAIRQWNLVC